MPTTKVILSPLDSIGPPTFVLRRTVELAFARDERRIRGDQTPFGSVSRSFGRVGGEQHLHSEIPQFVGYLMHDDISLPGRHVANINSPDASGVLLDASGGKSPGRSGRNHLSGRRED
jgi:hypothetical protein